jgi:BMFP domain-containing protein YqiC
VYAFVVQRNPFKRRCCGAYQREFQMSDDPVDGIARRLMEALPQNVRAVKEDLEKNFRSVVRSGLGRMDLVTREEFEVQAAVLARTRERLEALERELERLESGDGAPGG